MQPWKVVFNHAPGPCHLVSPIGKKECPSETTPELFAGDEQGIDS